jgi:hypothetical protein
MKNICSILIILSLFGLGGCSNNDIEGIDFLIRNRSTNDFLLKAIFSDQNGNIIHDLSVHLTHSVGDIGFSDKELNLNSQFETFIVELKLFSVPKGNNIAKLIGTWPGDAGTPTCASCDSDRIFVGVEITDNDKSVNMFFSGII